MFERFHPTARRLVVDAQEQVRVIGAGAIGSQHFLAAVLARNEGPGATVLRAAGIDETAIAPYLTPGAFLYPGDAEALASIGIAVDEIERRVEESFGEGALRRGPTSRSPSHIPFETEAKQGLEQSLRECMDLGTHRITPDHVLLGMLHDASHAAHVVRSLGHDPAELRRRLRSALGEAA